MAELRRRKEGETVSDDPSSQSDRRSGAESSDHVGILWFFRFVVGLFLSFLLNS